MTVDPFLLRGAELGAAWRAERGGAAGAVYHAVGGASLPIASDLPVVVTLLDLAPWELPEAFARSVASRFGQRLRGQLLRDAAAVIVGSEATARAARRLLHVRRDRAAGRPVRAAAGVRRCRPRRPTASRGRSCASGSVSAERYLVFTGRFDARLDSRRCSSALASLADAGPAGRAGDGRRLAAARPAGRRQPRRSRRGRARWRPARRSARRWPTPRACRPRTSPALVRGARAAILPVLSEAVGLPVIEALAVGTPVVASAVGPLPELVGPAGLLVEPRDADRLAVAIATIWADDASTAGLAAAARERAAPSRATWADVAAETRAVYAEVGIRRRLTRRAALGRPGPIAGSASRRGRRRRRRGRAGLERDRIAGRARGDDLDERLAGGQGDLLAARVEELGRRGERGLLPGPLDRPAVGRDPGRSRGRRPSPRGAALRDGRR